MPEGVGLVFFEGAQHLVDADLDAEVEDLVAVVGEDDVDEVLADVVHVTLHRREDDAAAAALVALFHVGFEVGDRRLHRLGALQDEGELHLAGREQVADLAHAVEQEVVDDVERRHALGHRGVEVDLEADARAVDDATAKAVVEFEVVERTGRGAGRRDALVEPEQHRERVVVVAAPVVDEVETDATGLVVDPVERQELGRVHDRGVESGVRALVQEDAVQHLARRRVETEGDVGESEDRAHARQFGLDPSNRLDGLDAVAARLDHARRERQRQRVDEDVLGIEAVARDGEVGDRARGAHLPLGGSRLSLFVDAGRDDGRAELGGEGEETVEARARAVALFEVDRVEQGLAAEPGERLARDLRLGRVDHDRYRGLGRQSTHQFVHVGDAVGAGVVDADVEDVGALFDLVAADADARVPVALEHGVAELLRAVRVGPFADQQHRAVLLVVRRRVDRRDRGLQDRRTRGRRERAHRLDDARDVLRRRAATAADDLDAVLGHELREVFGQRLRA